MIYLANPSWDPVWDQRSSLSYMLGDHGEANETCPHNVSQS